MLVGHPALKFAVLVAGFRPRDLDHQHLWRAEGLRTPTLHLWGAQDVLKYKSEEATTFCLDPLVLTHRAGHKVPAVATFDSAAADAFFAARRADLEP